MRSTAVKRPYCLVKSVNAITRSSMLTSFHIYGTDSIRHLWQRLLSKRPPIPISSGFHGNAELGVCIHFRSFGRHGSHIISGQCLFGCFHGSYDIGRFPRLQHINLRGSKDTSQSTGLLAESWISFNNEEPVFRTTNSIRFTSPAVISVLNNPLGVDNSIS